MRRRQKIICRHFPKKVANFLTSVLFIRRLIMCLLCFPSLNLECSSEVKWSLDLCFGKDGHIGILDLPGSAWFCMNELLLPGAAGDLPRLNYFYIAAKFIADSHLFFFFNLELIQGNSWRESAINLPIQNTYHWIFPEGREVLAHSCCITPWSQRWSQHSDHSLYLSKSSKATLKKLFYILYFIKSSCFAL